MKKNNFSISTVFLNTVYTFSWISVYNIILRKSTTNYKITPFVCMGGKLFKMENGYILKNKVNMVMYYIHTINYEKLL